MAIIIENLQKRLPISHKKIKAIVKKILAAQRIEDATLNIVFVSAQKIRALNRQFKGRDHATDVLAFDLTEDIFFGKIKKARTKKIVGDIIISTDAVVKNALEFKSEVSRELILYVIHGILHFLEYDDGNPTQVKKMRAREQEILEVVLSTKL